MGEAERWFAERGAAYVWAESPTEATASLALYRKLGFTVSPAQYGHWPFHVVMKRL